MNHCLMRKTPKYWVKWPFLLKVTSENQIVHREPISNKPSYYFPFSAVYSNCQLNHEDGYWSAVGCWAPGSSLSLAAQGDLTREVKEAVLCVTWIMNVWRESEGEATVNAETSSW